jgi:hypothetical protein
LGKIDNFALVSFVDIIEIMSFEKGSSLKQKGGM